MLKREAGVCNLTFKDIAFKIKKIYKVFTIYWLLFLWWRQTDLDLKLILSLVLLINLIIVASVNAYIDPNTGGFFFQTVAPFVYGILGVIVVFWKRIVGFVKGLFGSKKGHKNSTKDI